MTATETLKHEHRIIQLVLGGARREAERIQSAARMHGENVRKILDFFANFVDRCHHVKEEKHLFTTLEKRGMSAKSGPVAVMLQEHEDGRRIVAAIHKALPKAAAGNKSALAAVSENLLSYVELLRGHIDKEDNVLYRLADGVLTPEDQKALSEAFEKLEAEEMGEGVHEKYHRLAHELENG